MPPRCCLGDDCLRFNPNKIEHGRKTKARLLNLFEGHLLQPSWAWQLGGCQPASDLDKDHPVVTDTFVSMCLYTVTDVATPTTLGDTYIILYLFIRPKGPQILI